jgi:hypothetical protein
MIGFVSAISASLAVIILITVSSLLGYVNSILPKKGIKKIDETHYQYIMGNVFVGQEPLNQLTLLISEIEEKNDVVLMSNRPVCNFGFNRSEREMIEIATFNFLKIKKYYGDQVNVLRIHTEEYEAGFNYCYLDVYFSKNL